MHHFYHIVRVTDLSVMRDQANVRTKDNNKFNPVAEESVIHLHEHAHSCRGAQHEFFPVAPSTTHTLASRFWLELEEKNNA